MSRYVRMVIGETISPEQVQEFCRLYNAEIAPQLVREPGFVTGKLIIEDQGRMAVSLTEWDSRENCLRYHTSTAYRAFVDRTQHLLVGDFVVRLFRSDCGVSA